MKNKKTSWKYLLIKDTSYNPLDKSDTDCSMLIAVPSHEFKSFKDKVQKIIASSETVYDDIIRLLVDSEAFIKNLPEPDEIIEW